MADNEIVDWKLRTDLDRRRALAVLAGFVHLTVALVFAYTAIGKIIRSGFDSYIGHFTNWSWTFQTLFYFSTLAVPFLLTGFATASSFLGKVTQTIIVLFLFPLNGILWVVVVVINVILATGGTLFVGLVRSLSVSIVIIGNDVFHFWPLVILLVYILAYSKFIFYSLNGALVRSAVADSPRRLTLFVLYQSYGGPLLALLFYVTIYNPQQVYQTDVNAAIGVAIVLATLTFLNLVPILIILSLIGVGSTVRYNKYWLLTNFNDPLVTESVQRVNEHFVKMSSAKAV